MAINDSKWSNCIEDFDEECLHIPEQCDENEQSLDNSDNWEDILVEINHLNKEYDYPTIRYKFITLKFIIVILHYFLLFTY
jgi:hypothetical protein